MPERSIDRFVEDRRARWARLAQLVAAANGRVSRLTADEVLELGGLYRAATGDLAVARRDFAHDVVAERVNDLVAAAHALVYSEAPTSPRRLRTFLARDLPASVRANLRFTFAAFGLFAVPAMLTYLVGIAAPELAALTMSDATRDALSRRTPGTTIPADARAFAGPLIIFQNVQVGILAFAGGMTGGLLTAWVLMANGAFLGSTFAVLQRAGGAGALVEFAVGHGILELSAIFLAGGAGLMIAWAMLRPGERSRGDALGLAGQQAVRTLLLVIASLVVAGLIEANVSPSDVPLPAKIAVGLAAGAALWAYIGTAGRSRAAAA